MSLQKVNITDKNQIAIHCNEFCEEIINLGHNVIDIITLSKLIQKFKKKMKCCFDDEFEHENNTPKFMRSIENSINSFSSITKQMDQIHMLELKKADNVTPKINYST